MELAPPNEPRMYDTFDGFLQTFAGTHLTHGKDGHLYKEMYVQGSHCSCGVTMLSGLSETSPEQIVNKVLKQRNQFDTKKIREAFVVFSDIDYSGCRGGNELFKYIKKNNLGHIVEFGPRMNPNTGNMIKIWVWEPPHESLAPKDKWMPVYGKVLKPDVFGNLSIYEEDPRFQRHSGGREA
jgi:hypothetical protein